LDTDRINNKIANLYSNCVISCLTCNVNRKDMLFKQLYRLEALKRYDKIYPLIHINNEDNKLAYEKLKNNICGGLSLVFHRYHEKIKLIFKGVNISTINGSYLKKEI